MYNKNNEKRRNGNRQQRPKFEQVTLKKVYETFENGLNDLRSIDQELNCIFADFESTNDITITKPADAKAAILRDLSENIPEFSNKDTKYYALNISSNRVVYKLPSTGISFGWKLVYDRETETTTYEFTVIASTYSAMKYIGNELIDNYGWDKVEK